MAVFTVDWEPWYSFKPYGAFWEDNNPMVAEPTHYLLDLLRRHQVRAVFYVVGWLIKERRDLYDKIVEAGHIIGDHTYHHSMDSGRVPGVPFRAPRWQGEKRLYSGGFWLRAMPYWWLKREVERTGIFFIHPHDLLWEHPKCEGRLQNLQRQWGLKTSRDKLERLMREVKFEDPSEYLHASAS
jgi:hypothetical protein